MALEGLVDVYQNPSLFQVDWSENLEAGGLKKFDQDLPILFEDVRFKGSPGNQAGEPVIVEFSAFKALFGESTAGVLQKVDNWENCIVAGGQVLGCLRGMSKDIDNPSDVDIFMYGLPGHEQALQKLHTLLTQIHEGYKIANRCDPVSRPSVFIDVIKTDHTISLVPYLPVPFDGESVTLPKVQFVTRKFATASDIVSCFDIDCCCVAFDGTKVWASPRAVRALRSGVNLIDLKFRSATFENRLLKYSRRGFAVQDPSMRKEALACLDAYFGGQAGAMETVALENLVRCIRRSSGLLKLLLADLAGKRGIIWAGMIVEVASFEAADIHADDVFGEEYGGEAVDDKGAPRVFHPPHLQEDWMRHYPHRALEKLLDDWGKISGKGELDITFVPTGPEINTSRADWERGVYEDSFQNIDALLNLPRPQPAFATAPESAGAAETASGGHPEQEGRAKKLRAGESSGLLGLPNLLLIEVLNRCSAGALASLTLSCKALERAIVHAGVWQYVCVRDFGPAAPSPGAAPTPPEQWARAYRDLLGLEKMGWREWDVSPMRMQALWREGSAEKRAAYRENVPLPCALHATALIGNKLILTGGTSNGTGVSGTFAFNLSAKEWTKVPTKLRFAHARSGAMDWEFEGRSGHTMTAVNDHEAVILFGNETGGRAPLAREAYLLDSDTWTYTSLETEGVPPAPRKGHSACLHPDGKSVIVFGGLLSSLPPVDNATDLEAAHTDDCHVLAQEWRDEKRVWVWRQLETEGETPHPQRGHGACVVGDRMVVLGGFSDDVAPQLQRMKVWLLELKTLRWSHPNTLDLPPSQSAPSLDPFFGAAVPVGNKVLFARGGVYTNYFDLTTMCWGRKCTASDCKIKNTEGRNVMRSRTPSSRTGHCSVRVGYSIYLVGGFVGRGGIFEHLPVIDLLGYDGPVR